MIQSQKRNGNSTNICNFIWNQSHLIQDFVSNNSHKLLFLPSQYIHLTKQFPYEQPQTLLASVVNVPWKTISILFLTCIWQWLSVYLWSMKTHSALYNLFIPFSLPCPWQMEVCTSSSQEQKLRTLLSFKHIACLLFVSQILTLLGLLLNSFSI